MQMVIKTFFLAGLLAGLSTASHRVGFVAPIEENSPSTIQVINAFYIGLYNASEIVGQPIDLLVYFTGSYDDNILASKAARLLIANGTDIIAYVQDFYTVADYASNSSIFAIGYQNDVQQFVGSRVLCSTVNNWPTIYDILVKNLIQVLATPNCTVHQNLTDCPLESIWTYKEFGISSDFVTLGTISYFVNNSTVQIVNDSYTQFYYNYTATFCNAELLSTISGFNSTTGCISDTISRNIPLLSQIQNLGYVTYTPIPFDLQVSFVAIINTGVVLSLIVILSFFGLTIYYRKTKQIVYASFKFCLLMLFGALLIVIGVSVATTEATQGSCYFQFWFIGIGFITLYGFLVAKTWRIALIFSKLKTLESIVYTDTRVFINGTIFVGIEIILLIVLNSINGVTVITPVFSYDDLGNQTVRNICNVTGNSAYDVVYVALAFKLVLIIAACIIIYRARSVDAEFNESSQIANCMYSLAFAIFILASLYNQIVDFESRLLIICIGLIFTTLYTLTWLFIPKFLSIKNAKNNKS